MTIWRMRISSWTPKATNAHSEYVTRCFPTATVVVRTRLNITVYVHCLSCFIMTIFSSKLLIPDRWHNYSTRLDYIQIQSSLLTTFFKAEYEVRIQNSRPEIQLCDIQDNPVVDEPNQVASCSLYCGKKLCGLHRL
jgi:hypothetical protein